MEQDFAFSSFKVINSPDIFKKKGKRTYARVLLGYKNWYWVLVKFIGGCAKPDWVAVHSLHERYDLVDEATKDIETVTREKAWNEMWWPDSPPHHKSFPHLFVDGLVHMRIDWGHELKRYCKFEESLDPIESGAVMTFQPLTCSECIEIDERTERWSQQDDLLDMIAGDESDGVYWGIAHELGLDPY